MSVLRQRSLGEEAPVGVAARARGTRLRRGRIVFWSLVALLLAAPVVMATASAIRSGWVPESDDAIVTLYTSDVFSSQPPLVGMPSTLGGYSGGTAAAHPGPAEFDVLALPYRLTGGAPWALLASAATIGLVSLAIALIALQRRAGTVVAAWAAVLFAALLWGLGSATVREILNPSIALLPLMAYVVLVAVVIEGAVNWFPMVVAFGSFVLQCHLSYLGVVALPGAAAVAALVAHSWRAGDDRHCGSRAAVVGVVVGLAIWLQPIIQQFTGSPGNLTSIANGFTSSGLPKAGFGFATHAVAQVAGIPIFSLHPRDSMVWTIAPAGATTWALLLLPCVSLVLLAALAIRWRVVVALRAAGSGVLILLAGFLTAMLVPRNAWIVDGHSMMSLYPVAAGVWITIGWAAVALMRQSPLACLHASGTLRSVAAAGGVASMVALSLLGRPGSGLLQQGEIRIASQVAGATRDIPKVPLYRIKVGGAIPFISTGAALAVALQRHGQGSCIVLGLKVPAFPFGAKRRCPQDRHLPTLLLQSGGGVGPEGSRLVATADGADASDKARFARLHQKVVDAVARGALRLTPRGEDLLRTGRFESHGPLVGDLLGSLREATDDPRTSVDAGAIAVLAQQGLLTVDGLTQSDLSAEAALATLAGPEGRVSLYLQP